ncbi:hypothetical protein L0F63_006773, partial [Massospora cicadina]
TDLKADPTGVYPNQVALWSVAHEKTHGRLDWDGLAGKLARSNLTRFKFASPHIGSINRQPTFPNPTLECPDSSSAQVEAEGYGRHLTRCVLFRKQVITPGIKP